MAFPQRFWIFLAALGGEIVLGILGYAIGAGLGRLFFGGGMLDLGLGILGLIIGTAIGNSLGAWQMAHRLEKPKAAWRYWLFGILVVLVVLLLAEPLRLNQNTVLLLAFWLALPPLVQAVQA